MPVRGTFQSFPPAELIQFLAHTEKRGVLRAYDKEDAKFLEFRDGQLVFAVHQRQVPQLRELVVRRGLVSEEEVRTSLREQDRWDEVVSHALRRRRILSDKRLEGAHRAVKTLATEGETRLRSFLLVQGRLTEEEFKKATRPEGIPDEILEEILESSNLVEPEDLRDARLGAEVDQTLFECILERGILSRNDVVRAISEAPDSLVAEVLIAQEFVGRTEARQSLAQLRLLRNRAGPNVRLGQYLVATGQVSPRQFERALEEQLVQDKRLGEILIEQRIITADEIAKALEEIEFLKLDFGPLYLFRRELIGTHVLDVREFADLLSEQKATGRSLSSVLTKSGKMTDRQLRRAVKHVLVNELCDLLLWPYASFEFLNEVTLQQALAPTEVPSVDSSHFDPRALLLEAQRSIGKLRRVGQQNLSLSTVFVATDSVDAEASEAALFRYQNVIRSFDGRSSLREVRRLIPGNRYTHFKTFVKLLDDGLIRPIGRWEAFIQGDSALEEGKNAEALTLFRHALGAPGNEPPNADVQGLIEVARTAVEKRPLQVLGLRSRGIVRMLEQTPLCRWLSRKASQSKSFRAICQSSKMALWQARFGLSRANRRLARVCGRARLSFEDSLIRSDCARILWQVKVWMEQRFHLGVPRGLRRLPAQAALVIALIAVALAAIFLHIAASPEVSKADAESASLEEAAVNLRFPSAVFDLGVPLGVAPTLQGDWILAAARDGLVRSLKSRQSTATSDAPRRARAELLWKLRVGEFGDLISEPVVVEELTFFTTVRGWIYAVSHRGETLWKKKFRRLETIPPTPLLSEDSAVVGLAVVGRESVYVLSPENGATLYQLQTGNQIVVRPLGDAHSLFVGSTDDHVYRADWPEDELRWDYEEADDVIALSRGEGVVLFATKAGGLSSVNDENGRQLWKRTFPRRSIEAAEIFEGQIVVRVRGGSFKTLSFETGETRSTFIPERRLEAASTYFLDGHFYYVSKSQRLGEVNSLGELCWQSDQPVGNITGWRQLDDQLAVSTMTGKLFFFTLVDDDEDSVARNE